MLFSKMSNYSLNFMDINIIINNYFDILIMREGVHDIIIGNSKILKDLNKYFI